MSKIRKIFNYNYTSKLVPKYFLLYYKYKYFLEIPLFIASKVLSKLDNLFKVINI